MGFESRKYNASLAGIVYLHLTLWGALITISLSILTFSLGASDPILVPCGVLLILASMAALCYIAFHQLTSRRWATLAQFNERDSSVRRPVSMAMRLSMAVAMLWLISSGWNMIIAARKPICAHDGPMLRLWQVGGTCMVQRAGTAFSMINLLSACALFLHIAMVKHPFESQLFGMAKKRPITVTPYRFSAALRVSRDKLGGYMRSASREAFLAVKPLPQTPHIEKRPLTPTVEPIGLGIWNGAPLPVSPPMMSQRPPTPSTRPSFSPMPPSSPSLFVRSPLSPRYGRNSTQPLERTSLAGFIPPKEIRRPEPTKISSAAWRALHPPASEFRYGSPNPSPNPQRNTVHGLAELKSRAGPPTVTVLSDSGSSSGDSFVRGHTRNRSAPFIGNEKDDLSALPALPVRASTVSHTRRRGHIRCTSDPNEMISAHMAAQMDVAMRLDQKLREVSEKVEAQRGGGRNRVASPTSNASDESDNAAKDSPDWPLAGTAVRKSKSDAELAPSRQKIASELYAKMEWDVLMGKEVNVLE